MAIREAMTRYGKLIGAPSNCSKISVFRGIPYAKAPVGERRWKAPEPLDLPDDPTSVEPRLCHSFAKMSMQVTFPVDFGPNKEGYSYPEPMSEDSLYLNVWTPAERPDEKLPVMMWIHGGAYLGGHSYSSTVNGEAMGKQGVVLVSIAYRLGAFGFLAHPALSAESPGKVSGNYGTLDQIAALRWVHENIAAFGGDPDNITVFGQSAGAHSTQILASSPLSRGLISRAILQSGASMADAELLPMPALSEAQRYGEEIFAAMGLSSLEEVRAIEEKELLERIGKADQELSGASIADLHFVPNLDGFVLPEPLGTAATADRFADIELMMGHTDEGGLEFPLPLDAYPAWLATFGEDARELEGLMGVESQADLDALNPMGFRGKLVTATAALGEARAKTTGGKSSYHYYFARPLPGDDAGAAHTAELFYVFNGLNYNWRPYAGVDYEIANVLNAYWANFAKTGDPNGKDLPRWEAFDPASPAHLRIGEGETLAEALTMEQPDIAPWQRFLIDWAQR